jgi:uncharacterized protein (DUF342 family)
VFEDTILKTLKTYKNDYELKNMISDVYGLENEDYKIEYDSERHATLTITSSFDFNARIAVKIMDSGQRAYLSLFPAINEGEYIDNKSLEEYVLEEKKLEPDLINWDNLKNAFQYYADGYIVEDFLIAEGVLPIDGRDAHYELHFEQPEKKPKELEDGSVDFKSFNTIVTVKEDDILLTYYKETDGIEGMKVTGEAIQPKKGRKINIRKGNNVYFDEETSAFYASQAGHITFESNKLNVNPIYAVRGDVDYSEGNVEFDGTVTISGDVLSGFSVKAKNISIWGVVRDATIEAEEDVVIKTGIKSTGKGVVRAGNKVAAGFMEGAEVHAGISVDIKNYCLNSRIFCEGEINAFTGDGIISGGEYHAYSSIRAKQFGMDNGPSFFLHVGVKHYLNERLEKLMAKKEELEKILVDTDKKIKQMAKQNPDIHKNPKLKSIITSRGFLVKQYESIDTKVEDLIKDSMYPMPFIRVDKEIYEGVGLMIYSTEHIIKSTGGPAKYVFHKGSGKIIKVKTDAELEAGQRKKD